MASRREDFEAYAVVFDGLLQRESPHGKVQAVVAEVGVEEEPLAWQFAQPYPPKTLLRRFQALGDIILFAALSAFVARA